MVCRMAKRTIGAGPKTRHQRPGEAALRPRKKKTAKRTVGRPPAGLAGEKVSNYQRTTLWLPPATKGQLDVLGRFLGKPQWAVIVEALSAYEKTLSTADRRAIGQMMSR